MIVEKATGLYEQSPQAGHEVWQGHLGIQTYLEGPPEGKGKNGSYLIELPAPPKV